MPVAIITALLPAIGQLAMWLVGLIIKKAGPKPELMEAHAAIARSLRTNGVKSAHSKYEKGFTSGWVALLIAAIIVGIICVWSFSSHADPITTNAGKSTSVTATIANGATVSGAVDLGAFTLVGINFPAAFTGTTVTFQMANSIAGTYQPVYNSSGAVSYTVAQARYYAINPSDFHGVRFLKVVSGSAEGAARTLNLSLKTQY